MIHLPDDEPQNNPETAQEHSGTGDNVGRDKVDQRNATVDGYAANAQGSNIVSGQSVSGNVINTTNYYYHDEENRLRVAKREALIGPYTRQRISSSSPDMPHILIDQSHRQAEWRGYPTPEIGYRDAANLLVEDYAVLVAVHGPLSGSILECCDILMLPTPFGTMVENEEYEAIARWVYAGNGILVFGNYLMESHHYINLNQLMYKFGIEFSHDLVMPSNREDFRSCRGQAFGLNQDLIVVTEPTSIPKSHPLLSGVHKVAFQSSCTVLCSSHVALSVSTSENFSIMKATGQKNEIGKILQIEDYVIDKRATARFLVGLQYGAGRVLAIGSWKIFLNDFIHNETLDNGRLLSNAVSWLAQKM